MIIVCEPIATGFVHAQFNAAFLTLILKVFPAETILFHAQTAHFEQVIGIVKKHDARISERITHSVGEIFIEEEGNVHDMPKTIAYICAIHRLAKKHQATRVFFSVTTVNILFLLQYMRRPEITYVTVFHSLVEKLISPAIPKRIWRLLLSLKRVFGRWHTAQVRIVVLGEYIRQNILKTVPSLASYIYALDMPYFFPAAPAIPQNAALSFISPGVVTMKKNSHLLFELAKRIKQQHPAVRFLQVGKVNDQRVREYFNDQVELFGDTKPVERDQFDALIKASSFMVLFYPSHTYRYTASAVLFDALAACKPIIAIRNDAFDHYFKRFGDIGYLFDTPEELYAGVQDLIVNYSAERYQALIENIMKARSELVLDRLAISANAIFK